jgi:hypothetical protein
MGYASVNALERLQSEHLISRQFKGELTEVFEAQIDLEWQQLRELVAKTPELAEANVRLVQQQIVGEQKRSLTNLLQQGMLSQEIYEELMEELDNRLSELYDDTYTLPSPLVRGADAFLPERLSSDNTVHDEQIREQDKAEDISHM